MSGFDEVEPEIAEMTERLLGSWRNDAAPSGAKRAAMAAVGVGLATTASTATASGLGGAVKASVLGIVKAVAGGALAGVVVVGTSTYLQHAHAPEPVSTSTVSAEATAKAPSRHASAAPARPPSSATTEIDPTIDVAPAPPAPLSTRPPPPAFATPPAGPTAGPSQERVSSLARETALLDESRAALNRGDAAGALKMLDRHAAEFARGNLGPEAVVMRIEALLRLGDERSARSIASQFAIDHPDDSHLARIKSLLTNTKKPTGDRP